MSFADLAINLSIKALYMNFRLVLYVTGDINIWLLFDYFTCKFYRWICKLIV